jgi:hypothetical protein
LHGFPQLLKTPIAPSADLLFIKGKVAVKKAEINRYQGLNRLFFFRIFLLKKSTAIGEIGRLK